MSGTGAETVVKDVDAHVRAPVHGVGDPEHDDHVEKVPFQFLQCDGALVEEVAPRGVVDDEQYEQAQDRRAEPADEADELTDEFEGVGAEHLAAGFTASACP